MRKQTFDCHQLHKGTSNSKEYVCPFIKDRETPFTIIECYICETNWLEQCFLQHYEYGLWEEKPWTVKKDIYRGIDPLVFYHTIQVPRGKEAECELERAREL